MTIEQMVPLYKSAQTSLDQKRQPQTEHPLTEAEECQAHVLSAKSHSEGLLHPPSLVSRPSHQLQDVHVLIPKPVQVLYLLSLPKNHLGLSQISSAPQTDHHTYHKHWGLKVCFSAQVNAEIHEHSGEEVPIGEYAGRAFAT